MAHGELNWLIAKHRSPLPQWNLIHKAAWYVACDWSDPRDTFGRGSCYTSSKAWILLMIPARVLSWPNGCSESTGEAGIYLSSGKTWQNPHIILLVKLRYPSWPPQDPQLPRRFNHHALHLWRRRSLMPWCWRSSARTKLKSPPNAGVGKCPILGILDITL